MVSKEVACSEELFIEGVSHLYNATMDFEKGVKMKLWILVAVLVILVTGCGSSNEEFTAPTEKTEIIEDTTAAETTTEAQVQPRDNEEAAADEVKKAA